MAKANNNSSQITRGDVALGAPITGFITFLLLTWSGTLPESSPFKIYVSDVSVSIVATLSTYIITAIIAYLRFLVSIATIRFAFHVKRRSYRAILDDDIMSETAKKEAQRGLDELVITYTKQVAEAGLS